MGEPRKPRVPLAAVVVGGFLAGGGLFGLFRVASAEPVPDPLPPVKLDEPRPDPFGALPVPSMPTAVPPVTPAAGIVPPVVPVPPKPEPAPLPEPTPLPKPVDTLPVPKPVDPIPLPPVTPPVDALPLPKPVDPVPVTKPVDPLPPVPKPTDTLPPVPGIDPLPRPVETPQPVTPIGPPAPVPPAKPENVLRPEPPPLTVNPGPTPVGTEALPPPRKVGNEELPSPRPVVEETFVPAPAPGSGGVPIVTPTTPGFTPMPVSRTAVLSALVGAALSAPAYADDPKPADAKALEAIQKQIDDLKTDLKLLQSQKKELSEQLYGRGDGKAATTDTEKGVLKRLKEAEEDGKKMAERIKDLETKLAQKSVSEKQPLGGSTIAPGKGLVKLVNEYNTKVSMMVNGTSYQLDVNQVKEIQVPEGELKYELVEFPNASAKQTTIKEGETVTLRIK